MKYSLLLFSVITLVLSGCALSEKTFSWHHVEKGWGYSKYPFNKYESIDVAGTSEFSQAHSECNSYAWRNAPTHYTTIKNNNAVSTTTSETNGWEYREIFVRCLQENGWKRDEVDTSRQWGGWNRKYEWKTKAQIIIEQGGIALKAYDLCRNNKVDHTWAYERLDKVLILKSENKPDKVATLVALNRYITEDEKNDVLEYVALRNSCRKPFIDDLEKVSPDLSLIYSQAFEESDSYTTQLIKKQITIGESNQRAIDMMDYFKKKLLEYKKKIDLMNKAEWARRRI